MRKVLIGIVVLVVLGVAGVFVYAWIQRDTAPKELEVTDRPRNTAPAPSAVEGAWKVTPASEVRYRVIEDFLGGATNSPAVGRTNQVTGEMTIVATSVTAASFTTQMASVKSDSGFRDNAYRDVMDVQQRPTSTFELRRPIELGSIPADGQQVSASATGALTLRGVTNEVTFEVTARRNGAEIDVQGSIPVVFADYQIPNPSRAMVTTRDNGTLEFLLVFAKA